MTPDQIAAEYLRRERSANAPGGPGADVAQIIADMVQEYSLTRRAVVQAVLDHTILGPN